MINFLFLDSHEKLSLAQVKVTVEGKALTVQDTVTDDPLITMYSFCSSPSWHTGASGERDNHSRVVIDQRRSISTTCK